MTREQRVAWCQVCVHRKLDLNRGLLCSLTGNLADFEGACDNQVIDEAEREHLRVRNEMIEEEEAGHPTDFKRNIVLGLICIIVGVGVVVATFLFPIAGVLAVIPYGIIAYGIAVLVRGMSQRKKART